MIYFDVNTNVAIYVNINLNINPMLINTEININSCINGNLNVNLKITHQIDIDTNITYKISAPCPYESTVVLVYYYNICIDPPWIIRHKLEPRPSS